MCLWKRRLHVWRIKDLLWLSHTVRLSLFLQTKPDSKLSKQMKYGCILKFTTFIILGLFWEIPLQGETKSFMESFSHGLLYSPWRWVETHLWNMTLEDEIWIYTESMGKEIERNKSYGKVGSSRHVLMYEQKGAPTCLFIYIQTFLPSISLSMENIVALLWCACPVAVFVMLSSKARGCQEQSSMLILDIPPNKNSHGSVNLRAI